MLPLALALPLLFPVLSPGAQDDGGPPPEKVAATLAALEEAFAADQKELAPRVAAVQSAGAVESPEVVQWLERHALRHREREVQRATIDVLGLMERDEALAALHGLAKRDARRLKKDTELYVAVLKAIGRHGSPSSIPFLTDDLFAVPDHAAVQARLFGLGNIRAKESVEELFQVMRVAGRQRIQPHMDSFRLSLAILTGADQGVSQDLWTKWWNDHEKGFTVAQEPPELPAELQSRWDRYWGNPPRYERQKRRGERGDDPERDGD